MKRLDARTLAVLRRSLPWIALAAVLALLLALAHLPWWRNDLANDVVTFHWRAQYFLEHGTWRDLGENEYQPGALWFFVLVGAIGANAGDFDAFLTAIFLINAALIVAHFLYFKKRGGTTAALVFLLLVAALGPILLFRFELLLSLLVLLAFDCFERKRYGAAGLLLGLATATKLYPVLLLPLLIIALLEKRDAPGLRGALGGFLLGGAVPTVVALDLGMLPGDLLRSIQFHALKPVGFEGFLGTFLTIVEKLGRIPLQTVSGFGITGLASGVRWLPDALLNDVWLAPVGLLLLWAVIARRRNDAFSAEMCFLMLFLFACFSKVLNPQYLWWFAAFAPLLLPRYGAKRGTVIIALLATAFVLTQIVYPLWYGDFVGWFKGENSATWIFAVSVLRNALLVSVLAIALDGRLLRGGGAGRRGRSGSR